MSAHKKKGVVAASSGIVVGDGKHHHRHYNLHLKLAGVALACVIIITAAAYGTLALVHHFKKNTSKTQVQTNSSKQVPLTPAQNAEYLASQGKYDQAQKIYDDQLKSAAGKTSQASAYTAKATVAFSARDYAAARTYESKADSLAPTAYTAGFLGDITMAEGDNKAAAGYYQLALDRLDKKSATYGYEANKIQAKLNGAER